MPTVRICAITGCACIIPHCRGKHSRKAVRFTGTHEQRGKSYASRVPLTIATNANWCFTVVVVVTLVENRHYWTGLYAIRCGLVNFISMLWTMEESQGQEEEMMVEAFGNSPMNTTGFSTEILPEIQTTIHGGISPKITIRITARIILRILLAQFQEKVTYWNLFLKLI